MDITSKKLCHTDLTQYNKLLVKAILDAQHTFNVIESGGEIENTIAFNESS